MNEQQRQELLNIAKPALFNTPMVRAILRGRKSATRRVVKYYGDTPISNGRKFYFGLTNNLNGSSRRLWAGFYKESDIFYDCDGNRQIDARYYASPCKPGDVLYVRETWAKNNIKPHDPEYLYRADYDLTLEPYSNWQWKPAIHMPKEAARIFLRVTAVRVERLWDINEKEAIAEGVGDPYEYQESKWYDERPELLDNCKIAAFAGLWDSTIKKRDLDLYGWEANPWVWVIEFERVHEEE